MILIYRRAVLAFVLAMLLFTPLPAQGGDVDDVKTTYEQLVGAINKRDVDALAATMHDQTVGFGPLSPFPSEDKAAIRWNWQAIFTNNESVNLTPINPQYRVIGNTGVAWGHAAFTVKPKDGSATTTFNRYTVTYVKVDGKWLSVAGHVSLMPAGR